MQNMSLYILFIFSFSFFLKKKLYFILNNFFNLIFMVIYNVDFQIGEKEVNALKIRVIPMMAVLITKNSVFLKGTKRTKLWHLRNFGCDVVFKIWEGNWKKVVILLQNWKLCAWKFISFKEGRLRMYFFCLGLCFSRMLFLSLYKGLIAYYFCKVKIWVHSMSNKVASVF